MTNIRRSNERIEFDVSRTGVPVIVKTSYYPNWEVRGADGPWRATPSWWSYRPSATWSSPTAPPRSSGSAGCSRCWGSSGWCSWCCGPGAGPSQLLQSALGAAGTLSVPPRTGAVRTGLDVADSLDAIFKAYDVRGVYPDEIDESVARRIGNAFVAFTNTARVLVATPARRRSR